MITMLDSIVDVFFLELVLFCLFTLAWVYKEVTIGICCCRRRIDGKVALVTGKLNADCIIINSKTTLDYGK